MVCKCGSETCGGVCITATGDRLIKYLNSIKTVSIPDYGDASSGLRVIGAQGFKSEQNRILVRDTYEIETEDRFRGTEELFDIQECMADAINKLEYTEEEKEQYTNMLRDIQTGKQVISPLKTGDVISIEVEDTNGNKRDVKSYISKIKWSMNKEIMKFECEITASFVDYKNNNKKMVYMLNDYGKTFCLHDCSNLRDRKKEFNIIEISKFGYIYPIEILNDLGSLIVDNQYVYIKTKEKTTLVGMWFNNEIRLNEEYIEERIGKEHINLINENIKYIRAHRKYIIPYMLADTNKIELKKK